MQVYAVWCRIDGVAEFDRAFSNADAARDYCLHQNQKPAYFGRCTWSDLRVYDCWPPKQEMASTCAKEGK